MAIPVIIERYGSQLTIIMDDGTRYTGEPTSIDLWLIGSAVDIAPPISPPTGNTRFIWPFDPRPQSEGGTVTSEYGMRDGRLHAGIDMAPGAGTPVPASSAGSVTVAGIHGGYGNTVVLDHGDGLATLYGHMQDGSLTVNPGDRVNQGQTLGRVGNTGQSFGAHLHWETHTGGYRWYASSMNPRDFMAIYGV